MIQLTYCTKQVAVSSSFSFATANAISLVDNYGGGGGKKKKARPMTKN